MATVTNVRIGVAMLAAVCLSVAGGEVRYLAANGDDAKDGTTPETAWRTVRRLNSGLPGGGTARLRCGDVFYGMIQVKGGTDSAHRTTVTSFGDGPKPVISCIKNLRDDADYKAHMIYLNYAPEIQGMIYTTNWIERLNRDFRRVTRMRTAMPNEESVLTLLGSVAMEHKAFDRILPKITTDRTLFP